MWQHAPLFYRLETVETMRAYFAHNMNRNEDFFAILETMKSETAAAQKLVEEGVDLLRKAEEEKETVQTEAHQLVEKKKTMAVDKNKAEKKAAQLRHELQDLRVGFATQKEDLEVDYQKQVDDIFLYDYLCCIKKHGIIHDALSFPSDDEDEFLGDPSQRGGDVFEGGPFGE